MKNILKSVLFVLLLGSAGITTAQTPVLSSYPAANGVILLDFDGHTVDATSWNYAGPIVCAPSGLNSDQITTIFNRIAEDYRPFNINVTTDPAKYLAAPANKRMRVILTVTYQWYGSAGGVAFVGSFTWGDDTPCFVFTSLLNYNVKNIAEAAAHEAGHTLGLYHQAAYNASCVKTSDYNPGQGTGEIGWAPIMGVGYYQNLTLWNNGPNSFGCSNYQSDLDVITGINGFTYRTDDHGDNFASATTASFTGNLFSVNGVVERSTDQDHIKFILPSAGRLELNAIPYNVGTGNVGSDLDMQITLYNSAQQQISVYNPGTLLSSVVDTTLDAGTYYLKVEGKGNIYAPNYASLGSYALEGTFTAGIPLPLRHLILQGQLNGDVHQLNWSIDADETVIEQILEVSTDGRIFQSLTEAATTDRQYTYRPDVTGGLQYRMNVTFDNGRRYYSNIVTLRNSKGNPKPMVLGNLIQSNTITISSPGVFDYSLYDFNGRVLSKGQLANGMNAITANGLKGGVYVIRFMNGGEQWTDKIIRQ